MRDILNENNKYHVKYQESIKCFGQFSFIKSLKIIFYKESSSFVIVHIRGYTSFNQMGLLKKTIYEHMNHFNFFITSDFADQISDQSFQQDKLRSVVHIANPCIRAINWVLNQQECQEKCVQIVVSLAKWTLGKQFAQEILSEVEELLISTKMLLYRYNFMCEFMRV